MLTDLPPSSTKALHRRRAKQHDALADRGGAGDGDEVDAWIDEIAETLEISRSNACKAVQLLENAGHCCRVG